MATGRQVLILDPTSWYPGSQVKWHSVSMMGVGCVHTIVPWAMGLSF